MAETKGTRTPLVIALVVCVAISALSIASFSVAYGVDELETLDPVHDEVVDRQTDNSDAIADELKKYYPDLVEHLSDIEPATYAIPGLVRAKNIRARFSAVDLNGIATVRIPFFSTTAAISRSPALSVL